MDVRQLKNFVTVAERLHFREAALVLDTAQATLTYQMQSLERDLGVRLFERANRRIRLTDAGAVLLVEARRILAQIDVAEARVVEAAHGNRGTLVVGAIRVLTLSWLPRAFAEFRSRYPDVTIQLRVLKLSGVISALRNHEIQVGFAANMADSPEFASLPLWKHPLVVLLPASHPAARLAEVPLVALRGTPLITLSRRSIGDTYERVIALGRAAGIDAAMIVDVELMEELHGLVSCGLGFAILPNTGESLDRPEAVARPLAAGENGWLFETAAFWRRDETTPLVRRIIDIAAALKPPESLIV
jgi:DNA-binding transcriptional LysR family regulator